MYKISGTDPMYHNHHHDNCTHSAIKYCRGCDIVYCPVCGREWGFSRNTDRYTWVYPTITYGSTIPDDHVHTS